MMENLTSQLTRTCLACGIEKPLSAFLQLDKTQGTSYGKVCAKCRSQGKSGKPTPTSTDDERSTAPSGIGIRGKEKIYADTKREQKIHTLKELYQKEAAKKEDIKEDKIERVNMIEASEKKHREFYIDSKKRPNVTDKKAFAIGQVIAQQIDQKGRHIQSAGEQHRTTLETTKKQQGEVVKTIAKEEVQKTTTNFNNLFYGLEAGRSELQSADLGKFFTWLGEESAPIVKTLRQGLLSANVKQPQKEVATDKKPIEPSRRNR